MAKARATKTKRPARPKAGDDRARTEELLDPKKVHELFGVYGPYDPPPPPVPTKGFTTFWDPGCSIQALVKKQPKLFSHCSWLDGERFARHSDSWMWRQIDLTPLGRDGPMAPKAPDLPLARELICYLVLVALATGERIEIGRLRCKDVMPSGQRVCVGPWFPGGLEICTVSDRWKSPIMGYCALYTPVMTPRKK